MAIVIIIIWAAEVSRGWVKAPACRLLSCAVLCHIVSLQYLSTSSLHRLAGLPYHLFLSYGRQMLTREVHRSSLRRLMCPAQDHFIFLTLLIMSSNGHIPDRLTVDKYECKLFDSPVLHISDVPHRADKSPDLSSFARHG